GDAAGVLIVAPALILWIDQPKRPWRVREGLELAVLLLVLILVGGAIFCGWLPEPISHLSRSFVALPIMVWMAFRLGLRETATASLLLAGLALWGTLGGHGPFAGAGGNESLVMLQVYLGIVTITAIALASAVAERRHAEDALSEKVLELGRSNAELA